MRKLVCNEKTCEIKTMNAGPILPSERPFLIPISKQQKPEKKSLPSKSSVKRQPKRRKPRSVKQKKK